MINLYICGMNLTSFHITREYNQSDQNFYTEYFSHYLIFALNYINDEETCKDIVQEVFIKYWEIQSRFTDELSSKAFLYKSVRNGCLNYIRHSNIRKKYHECNEQHVESEDFFMDTVIKGEVASILTREIGKLPETGRKILMQAIEGYSNEEIAVNMRISINTVKTHKARSYIILRKNLEYLKTLLLFLVP